MVPNLNTGAIASAVSGLVSSVIAILAIFHVIAWSQPQNTAVVVAAVALAVLLFYVAGMLHLYGSPANFDQAQLVTSITTVITAIFGVLTAFNLPNFSPTEQASLLGTVGTLVAIGVSLWSFVKTHENKLLMQQIRQHQAARAERAPLAGSKHA